MFRPRIIPVLLLKGPGLYKSIRFRDHRYIGDPINAVKIFNDSFADELVFLDIDATKEGRCISAEFVRDVGEEASMPFSVGGGIRTIDHIRELLSSGAEKVVIGTEAVIRPEFIREASDEFGSSTIVVCIDVRKKLLGGTKVYYANAAIQSKWMPVEFAQLMQNMGAGEIILQSVDRDGTMTGYDLELIAGVTAAIDIPVVALGGAGSLDDLHKVYTQANANGLAAGSLFVFQGKNKGVLINYPDNNEIKRFSER